MKKLLRNSLILGSLCAPLPAAMTFTVVFSAQAQSDLSAADQALFTNGLTFWDDIIDDHQDNSSINWQLNVDTFSTPASGGGITLGSAGPSGLAFSGVVPGAATSNQRFIVSTGGSASFNVHPDAGALQEAVIKHEIGHALGIGTLWEDNEVYNDGNAVTGNRDLVGGTPGQYAGANALAAYQAEFDPGATFIPVELDGNNPGTAHGHWNEVTDNFAVENAPGFDSDPGDGGPAPNSVDGSLDDELMTGVLSGSAYLSNTTKQSLVDIVSQVLGGIAGAGILFVIASGADGFSASESGFASNGFGEHSPGGYSMVSVIITEIVLTAIFLIVILGATSKNAPGMIAPIAIGLCLTLIHLVSIPVSNTSVNPARSLGVAVFQGGWALAQVWVFWVAPIIGAVIGALIHKVINCEKDCDA